MAFKKEIWDMAKAMFEGGATLSDIQHKTKIHLSSVSKRAIREKWEKGKNSKIIDNDVNNIVDKSNLNSNSLEFHEETVAKRVKALKIDSYLDHGIGLAAKVGVKILQSGGASMTDVQQFSVAQNNFRVGLKTQEKFSSAQVTVNNTNAQQNNTNVEDEILAAIERKHVINH